MLRLLALTLLLPGLAQAQSLLPCLSDAEFQDIYQAMEDPRPFEVWGPLAGFDDDGRMEVCRGTASGDNPADTPTLFYALDDEGHLLLNATVMRGDRPLPYAVVIASTRDERDGPIGIVAIGVADQEGAIRMVLPPSPNALRVIGINNRKQSPEPPLLAELVDEGMSSSAQVNPVFVGQSDAQTNVLHARAAAPGDENDGIHFVPNALRGDDTRRMAESNRAFAHFGRRRTKSR